MEVSYTSCNRYDMAVSRNDSTDNSYYCFNGHCDIFNHDNSRASSKSDDHVCYYFVSTLIKYHINSSSFLYGRDISYCTSPCWTPCCLLEINFLGPRLG